MKNKVTLPLLGLMLFLAGACQKSETLAPASKNKAGILLDIAYDAGNLYPTDRPFEMSLTIEEQGATADHCFLIVTNSLGRLELSLEGQYVPLNKRMEVFYSVRNETESTRTLIFNVTPLAFAFVDPTFQIDFTVITADGHITASKSAEVHVLNTIPIDVQAEYTRDPILSTQTLPVDLTITKAGFTGDFRLEFDNTSGSGFCTYCPTGQTFHNNEYIIVHSNPEPLTIEYQPTSLGPHEIIFRVSDGECSREVEISCKVHLPESLAIPTKSGTYIHIRSYTDKSFYTASEWMSMDTSGLEVDGIACIDTNFRILLPLHALSPLPFCGVDDNLLTIPGIVKEDTTYGKDNTQKIHDAYMSGLLGSAPIVEACYNYNPDYPGQWYLPSLKLLQTLASEFLYSRHIRNCLELTGGTLLPDARTFATSTIYDINYIQYHEFLSGQSGRTGATKSTNAIYFFPVRDL